MKYEDIVTPIAKRIAELPYSEETKMKIAEFGGFATGFVGGAVLVGAGYAIGKTIIKAMKSK